MESRTVEYRAEWSAGLSKYVVFRYISGRRETAAIVTVHGGEQGRAMAELIASMLTADAFWNDTDTLLQRE